MKQKCLSYSEAVKQALIKNYINFDGRASRSEFWWFQLFTFIIYFALIFAVAYIEDVSASLVHGDIVEDFIYILFIFAPFTLLFPCLGVAVRRLHDIDKSGWWILVGFLPLVGCIILLVWFCEGSQMKPNEYGPVPNLTAY